MDGQAGLASGAECDGPQLRVAAFDVVTWNAPRSFHGATKATCFNPPPPPTPHRYSNLPTRYVALNANSSKSKQREKTRVSDVLFCALIFTWFSGGKLSQTLRRCLVAHTVNQSQPTL